MTDFLNVVKAWLRNEVSNLRLYYALIIVLLLGPILFVWLAPIFPPVAPDIPPPDYNTYECEAHGPANKSFSIYALSYHSAKHLADSLCADARVSKRVGEVKAQWRHQNITDLAVLQSLKYNLLIAHAKHIERSEIGGITGYTPIASYESYKSYFIAAQGEQPELKIQYFAGKRMGLRDNPLSQSGHIIPLQELRETGIDKQLIDIVYFKSHKQLREALLAGKVDVIGSYWSVQNIKDYGDLPRIELKPVAPSKWYLLPSNPDVVCAVTNALTQLKRSEKHYFSRLSIEPMCTRGKM